MSCEHCWHDVKVPYDGKTAHGWMVAINYPYYLEVGQCCWCGVYKRGNNADKP